MSCSALEISHFQYVQCILENLEHYNFFRSYQGLYLSQGYGAYMRTCNLLSTKGTLEIEVYFCLFQYSPHPNLFQRHLGQLHLCPIEKQNQTEKDVNCLNKLIIIMMLCWNVMLLTWIVVYLSCVGEVIVLSRELLTEQTLTRRCHRLLLVDNSQAFTRCTEPSLEMSLDINITMKNVTTKLP